VRVTVYDVTGFEDRSRVDFLSVEVDVEPKFTVITALVTDVTW
jgi:hypothetical protein